MRDEECVGGERCFGSNGFVESDRRREEIRRRRPKDEFNCRHGETEGALAHGRSRMDCEEDVLLLLGVLGWERDEELPMGGRGRE